MTVIKIAFITLLLCVLIVFFSLYKNGANLLEPPGMVERLKVFLTTNSASTRDNHTFKELRTPEFSMSADKLFRRVLKVAAALGWEVSSHDSENQNANFVVYSPVFLFKDDVFVQVHFLDMNHSTLSIQSSSRVGRADLAANSGHIQALIDAL